MAGLLPASIRYNNPGGQYPGPSARQFNTTGTETIGGGHKIAVFATPEEGAAAQFHLLNNSYTGLPLGQAISRWSGGNAAPAYAASVAQKAGIPLDTVLTPELLASPQGISLARAQADWEAGRPSPLTDAQWQAAQEMAFKGYNPPASGSPPGMPVQAGDVPQGTPIPAAQPNPGVNALMAQRGSYQQDAGAGISALSNQLLNPGFQAQPMMQFSPLRTRLAGDVVPFPTQAPVIPDQNYLNVLSAMRNSPPGRISLFPNQPARGLYPQR